MVECSLLSLESIEWWSLESIEWILMYTYTEIFEILFSCILGEFFSQEIRPMINGIRMGGLSKHFA
jgi:hypothetical protein